MIWLAALALAAGGPSSAEIADAYVPDTPSGVPEATVCMFAGDLDSVLLTAMSQGGFEENDRYTGYKAWITDGRRFGLPDGTFNTPLVLVHFEKLFLSRGIRILARVEVRQVSKITGNTISYATARAGRVPWIFQTALSKIAQLAPC